MKITALLYLVLSFFLTSLLATPSWAAGPQKTSDEVQKELLNIEREVAAAQNHCDRDAFDEIEAKEFIFTDSSGKVTTKQEDLDSLKDCHPKETKTEISEPRVQVHGETAILNAKLTYTVTRKDGTIATPSFRFTDVFVWRDGRWQMVLGQSTRIPEPKPQS